MDEQPIADQPIVTEPEAGDDPAVSAARTVADHPRRAAESASTRPLGPTTDRAARPADTLPGWPTALSARYRPERLLGSGGMGHVYAAWDTRLTRRVAIKLLQGENADLAQRFQREAQAQARIEHPGICKVYEVGEVGGLPFIAMQLIDGQALSSARGLSTEQKTLIICEVAEAVHAAHRAGLVHRDLKPANIMLETAEDGTLRPFVVDFGVVRDLSADSQTVDGATLGTPAFMAPEQALGGELQVDRRADIWGLGATLYWLLSGAHPVPGGSPMEVLVRLSSDEPVSLGRAAAGIPRDLQTVVMKCLERDPARRYPSARALADDLRCYLEGEPIAARPASLPYRLGKRLRKHRAILAVAAAGLVVAVVLLALGAAERRAAARQVELAQRFGQRVEQAEGLLWRARSIEGLDLRPIREQVLAHLHAIELETGSMPASARGPGHAAVGRGLLALGDLAGARRSLDLAASCGYQTPAVAYDTGLVLSRLYQLELVAASRIRDRDERTARRRQLASELRDPARAALRAAAGHDLGAPAYVEALLAHVEGRSDEALDAARRAFAAVPWMYEAKALEGEVLAVQALSELLAGEHERAARALAEAEAAFRAATAIAPGDVRVWTGWCELVSSWHEQQVWTFGADDPALTARALLPCQAGLVPDPAAARLHLAVGAIRLDLAELAVRRGQDPSTQLALAQAASEAALAAAPDDAEALRSLATVHWLEAKHVLNRHGDAGPPLREAVRFARAAVAAEPTAATSYVVLGNALLDLAAVVELAGEDPRPTLEEAIAVFARGAELDPLPFSQLVNQAMCWWRWAVWLATSDEDPSEVVARGLAALAPARELRPDDPYLLRTEASLQIEQAAWSARHGADPRPRLAEAVTALERATKVNATDTTALVFLVQARLQQLEYELDHRLPQAATAAATHAALTRLAAVNPTAADYYREQLAAREQQPRPAAG